MGLHIPIWKITSHGRKTEASNCAFSQHVQSCCANAFTLEMMLAMRLPTQMLTQNIFASNTLPTTRNLSNALNFISKEKMCWTFYNPKAISRGHKITMKFWTWSHPSLTHTPTVLVKEHSLTSHCVLDFLQDNFYLHFTTITNFKEY